MLLSWCTVPRSITQCTFLAFQHYLYYYISFATLLKPIKERYYINSHFWILFILISNLASIIPCNVCSYRIWRWVMCWPTYGIPRQRSWDHSGDWTSSHFLTVSNGFLRFFGDPQGPSGREWGGQRKEKPYRVLASVPSDLQGQSLCV